MSHKTIPLSSGVGEIMAPQTLVAALILSPDGTIKVDAGALHGRSEIEQTLRMASSRGEPSSAKIYWFLWVAVELDGSNAPVRYKGIAASELFVDPATGVGYKMLTEQVNRMAEAMRGGVNLKTIGASERAAIRRYLMNFSSGVWEQSADTFKGALA